MAVAMTWAQEWRMRSSSVIRWRSSSVLRSGCLFSSASIKLYRANVSDRRKIRNPKSEGRKKAEIRNPNTQPSGDCFGFRTSTFFRVSAFGFRVSTLHRSSSPISCRKGQFAAEALAIAGVVEFDWIEIVGQHPAMIGGDVADFGK